MSGKCITHHRSTSSEVRGTLVQLKALMPFEMRKPLPHSHSYFWAAEDA